MTIPYILLTVLLTCLALTVCSAEIEQWMKDKDMMKCGTDYRTVAVIGCQSSGKSTLLNLIFDTTFVVMDEQKGRQQTTKGIWLNRNEAGNILVLDIEGTDSKERGEQRMVSIDMALRNTSLQSINWQSLKIAFNQLDIMTKSLA